jgi:hypothetical protein
LPDGIGIFKTKNSSTYGHLENATAIWYILLPFGNLEAIWYIVTVFVYCVKTNLATLLKNPMTVLLKFKASFIKICS